MSDPITVFYFLGLQARHFELVKRNRESLGKKFNDEVEASFREMRDWITKRTSDELGDILACGKADVTLLGSVAIEFFEIERLT